MHKRDPLVHPSSFILHPFDLAARHPAGCTHGLRYGRFRCLFASSSPTTWCFSGSQVSVLPPSFIDRLASRQLVDEMYPCSMSATGLERSRVASRKLRWCPRLAVAAWASKSSSVASSGNLPGSKTALPLIVAFLAPVGKNSHLWTSAFSVPLSP